MKLIGLNIAYNHTNYGTILQAFATQSKINQLGYETEILDFSGKDLLISPESVCYFALNKLLKKKKLQKIEKPIDAMHKDNIEKRKRTAREFIDNNFKNIIQFNDITLLRDYSRKFDAVLIGSDQLWGPIACFTAFRSMMFVPKGVKRVSYATSMGVSKYPWYVKRQARKFFDKIDCLSVREDQAKDIIENISTNKAMVVLDPTYLLTKDEWIRVIPDEKTYEERYVLCYFLGDNIEAKQLAKEFAKERDLKLVTILSNEVNVRENDVDYIVTGKGPSYFVNLIRNAEFIFTDSFHGFAFSIINQKQVFVTYRNIANTPSKNSRIDNIVSTFNLEHRLIKTCSNYSFESNTIDYSCVNNILDKKRQESINFLVNALK